MNTFPIITAALSANANERMVADIADVQARANGRDVSKHIEAIRNRAERAVSRFLTAVETVTEAYQAGEIPNVTFKDTKDILNRSIEDAWKAAWTKPYVYQPTWAARAVGKHHEQADDMNAVYYGSPSLHLVNSFIKKLNKIKSNPAAKNAGLDFIAEIADVAAMMADLKTKVVKRQPKNPEDMVAKYLAPRASTTAGALVQDFLIDLTNDAYAAIKADFLAEAIRYVEAYDRKVAECVAAGKTIPHPYDAFSFTANGMTMTNVEAVRVLSLVLDVDYNKKPDMAEILDQDAIKSANEIRNRYIIKNLVKLDSILDAKPDFKSVTEIGRAIRMQSLEGTLKIVFKDGSSFICKTSVVWSHSIYGKPFTRVPLTFHDVVLPNGTFMERPSEERMNTVFVGKGA